VIRQGDCRRDIERTLNDAYASGLLSEETFAIRIEQLLGRRLIDPRSLIGDLSFRAQRGWRRWLTEARTIVGSWRGAEELLLALDWTGEPSELVIGRHYACDLVLSDRSVSRRHARIIFRDGDWVLQDLASTNGTTVNGTSVGRCVLRPGDHLVLGSERLRVD